MAHQRQVIRTAIRDLLDGATAAASRVYATRMIPLRRAELPSICVYTLEESVTTDSLTSAPRELTRELPVIIECRVAPGDNVDDAMDAIALEVETAMHADPFLPDGNGDAQAAESILDSTIMEVAPDGDRLTGFIALTYQVTYRTFAPEAPSGLDDFNTVGATHNMGGDQAAEDDTHDVFIVQEDE